VGYLSAIWDVDYDPSDASNPRGVYTPYSFVPPGHVGPVQMSMSRDFGRRESVQSIPGLDSVLDSNGRNPGPMDRRDVTFSFRVFSNDGDLDKFYDLLAAQLAPGVPVRLVYVTDAGFQWFTLAANPRIQQTLTAANSWGHGGYADFAVTWRIRPDWRRRFPSNIAVWRTDAVEGVYGTDAAEGVWADASTPLTAALVAFTADNTGTAGYDLPTLADTGPTVVITGPCGGAGGMRLRNNDVVITAPNGTQDTMYTNILRPLAANESYTLTLATRSCLRNGVNAPRDIAKPPWQREYLRIEPGIVNHLSLEPVGAAPVGGGNIRVVWEYKRA
jgi:hypothetical protein